MAHEKIQLARSRAQFARLLHLSQEQQKALAEDPKPFLDRAHRELSLAYRTLEEIKAVVIGDQVAPDLNELRNPTADMLRKLNKIAALLNKIDNPTERRNAMVEINTANKFLVTAHNGSVVVGAPMRAMHPRDALLLAAYLVTMAGIAGNPNEDGSFEDWHQELCTALRND